MSQELKKHYTPQKTLLFMVILSFSAALVLSVLSSSLRGAQERALELDRSKELLKSAQVLNHEGYFQILSEDDHQRDYVPAKYVGKGRLEYVDGIVYPTDDQILDILKYRILPKLVNAKGKLSTFEEQGIDMAEYLADFKTVGYFTQTWKLFYELLPNPDKGQAPEGAPVGYIIPVNGMGLWDAIYGYIAVEPDGDTVIGISWYDQKETPGLGANIADWDWQKQFAGKKIFQPDAKGETNFKNAPIGIKVVRGKVSEVFGASPKAENAVDGMAGATLTGNGVTEAYKHVLSAYRPFFIELHNQEDKKGD